MLQYTPQDPEQLDWLAARHDKVGCISDSCAKFRLSRTPAAITNVWNPLADDRNCTAGRLQLNPTKQL